MSHHDAMQIVHAIHDLTNIIIVIGLGSMSIMVVRK